MFFDDATLNYSPNPLTSNHYRANNAMCFDFKQTASVVSSVVRQNAVSAEKPVVFIVGEDHTSPLHFMTEIEVDNTLVRMRDGGFVVTREMPYNHLSISYGDLKDPLPPSAPDPRLCALKHQFARSGQAPLLNFLLYDHATRNEIPLRFVDALRARDRGFSYLSPDDKRAQDISLELTGSRIERFTIPIAQHPGSSIRNHLMFDLSKEARKEAGANVLVHQCGIEHMLGVTQRDQNEDPENSLSELYRRAGYHVVPIFITTKHLDTSTTQKFDYQSFPEMLIIDGLHDFVLNGADRSKADFDALRDINSKYGATDCSSFLPAAVPEYFKIPDNPLDPDSAFQKEAMVLRAAEEHGWNSSEVLGL